MYNVQTKSLYYLVILHLALVTISIATGDDANGAVQVTIAENADDKAIIPISRSKLLKDVGGDGTTTSASNGDVVIQLQNQGGGNMKLKLGHGVLVPVGPLSNKPYHSSEISSGVNSTNDGSSVKNLMKSYVDSINSNSSINSTTTNKDSTGSSTLQDQPKSTLSLIHI